MTLDVDLIIFDLDGTLLDTAPDIERCVNMAMRDFGLPDVPRDKVLAAIGPGGQGLFPATPGRARPASVYLGHNLGSATNFRDIKFRRPALRRGAVNFPDLLYCTGDRR